MSRVLPWAVAVGAAAAVIGVAMAGRGGTRVVHPDPRPGITAAHVLAPELVLNTPNAAAAYAAARQAPQLVDGLFCHCHCARNFGHRSLLTCFESDHGAQCDICIGEALLATRLAERGLRLDEIRHAIDERFGS